MKFKLEMGGGHQEAKAEEGSRLGGAGVRAPRQQTACCHRSQWFGLAGAHRVLQVCGGEISLGKLAEKLCSLHGSWDFIPRVLEGLLARGSVVALDLGGWNDHSPCLRPLVWCGTSMMSLLQDRTPRSWK